MWPNEKENKTESYSHLVSELMQQMLIKTSTSETKNN